MDDKTNVPDNMLFWVHPSGPIQSASLNHKGWSPTGIRIGSTAKGYYADLDKQVPVYAETQYRASIMQPGPGDWSQPASPEGQQGNDVAPNARGITAAQGVNNQTNFGGDKFYGSGSSSDPISLYNKATDAKGDKTVKFEKMLSGGLKTIANTPFQSGQKLLTVMKQVDPQNMAGAIRSGLDGITQLKNLTSAASSMSGGSNFSSLFNSLLQSVTSLGSGGSGGGGATPQISPQTINTVNAFVTQLILSPNSIPIGIGTQDNSILPTANTANTANSQSPQQQQQQSPANVAAMQNMAQAIIQQLISAFMNAGGDTGGLATYNQQQGALKAMEKSVQQLFSNMTDSPQTPGTQQDSGNGTN